MITSLTKLEDNTLELTITIPWTRVKTDYDQVLNHAVDQTELKGFRKGKAPRQLAEDQLDKTKLYEQVLTKLIPEIYLAALKEHQLQPIINPQISIISLEADKDWQIKAVTAELPKVSLADYKAAIKKELAAAKIWVPGKADPKTSQDPKQEAQAEEEKLAKVFAILLKTSTVIIPHLLIEDEVNRMLSRLIDQTARLGLTIDQYLASINKTSDQLKADYATQAKETLQLELILSQIATETNIQVDDQEVAHMLAAVPEEKTRKTMDTPDQKIYLKQLIRKRKVIDNLLHL